MSVQNPGEGVPGDSEHLRGFGNTQTERTQACVLNGMAGMRWVLHGHLSIPFRLVIVHQIDIKRIAIFEAERNPPVAGYGHTPVAFPFTPQRVKPVAG
jgi:hypothetical protein